MKGYVPLPPLNNLRPNIIYQLNNTQNSTITSNNILSNQTSSKLKVQILSDLNIRNSSQYEFFERIIILKNKTMQLHNQMDLIDKLIKPLFRNLKHLYYNQGILIKEIEEITIDDILFI